MWIITAWWHISPELSVKDFKKCYISNAVDGTDEDLLWNVCCGSECEKDEDTDCEDWDTDTDW
jgi:hypothetical protein